MNEELIEKFVFEFLRLWLSENNRATMAIIRETVGSRTAIESLEESFGRYCDGYGMSGMSGGQCNLVYKSLFTYPIADDSSIKGYTPGDHHFLRLSPEIVARIVKEVEQDRDKEYREKVASAVIQRCSAQPGVLLFWKEEKPLTPFPPYYWAMKFEVINNSGGG